jgi:S1-C subfamily serine protease
VASRTLSIAAAVALGAAVVAGAGGCGSDSSSSGGPGTLGIDAYDIDEEYAAAAEAAGREIPEHGAYVVSFLDDPPAQDSGIHNAAGGLEDEAANSDIIETVDGRPATSDLLRGTFPGREAGDKVKLHVWPADGEPHDVEVELAAVPQDDDSGGGYYPGG